MGKPKTSGRRPAAGRSGRGASEPGLPPVVGIGASAGGIAAFQTLAKHLPNKSGIAWVLIQHMAPDHESQLSAILARCTALPVTEVTAEMPVRPDHVYVIAPGHTMTIREGRLKPIADHDTLSRRTSIDAFLLSLAEDREDHCGCALLSGAGTDGTIGLKAVKEAGGLTVTQTLGSAEYDSMLLSAIRTGLVDRELPLEEIPGIFVDFLVHGRAAAAEVPFKEGDRLQVCRVLRSVTGHDFTDYKVSTVDRRIRRRMQMLGARRLPDYLARLEQDKREATQLFHDLLIGVTQFFRDPDTFTALARTVVPKVLAGRTADDEVRVWVPGCATGEEVYSLAMLFQEQASKLENAPEFRFFGTDIDESALHFARVGRYPKGVAADVSPERLGRFFEAEDGTHCIRNQLREVCLFAQHNVLKDPPFSRIDLISCRNLLIYMQAELQQRLLPVFHYALRRDGFLVLGPAENAAQHANLFEEIDKHRIFVRVGESRGLSDFPIVAPERKGQQRPAVPEARRPQSADRLLDLAGRRILAKFAPAYVVIDAQHDILAASAGTGRYLELPSGQPRTNLSTMARSGLAVDIRADMVKVLATGKTEVRRHLSVGSEEDRRHLTLTVEPLPREPDTGLQYLVVFQEEPATETMAAELPQQPGDDEVTRALEMELQSTKERLHSTLEELETSNEELRASNEELSSVNEELQASNEELETSKEELQSINEELRTVNSELSNRVEELSRANNDLKNLFANTRIAMLFLDEHFRIQNFTHPAKPLFRLRDHDIGRPLDELAPRLDYQFLRKQVEKVTSEGTPLEHEVEANDASRQTFIMRILPYRDEQERIRGAVLTFIDITQRKRDEERFAGMVSELNHRVKNTLAAVQAVVQQTTAETSSVEDYAETIQGRLQAMAAAHNLLSRAAWEHVDLEQLADDVLGVFAGNDRRRLTKAGPAIDLRAGIAVSVGLILHELATNAAKHGAWSVPEGLVELRWEYTAADGKLLILSWVEHGGPAGSLPEQPGFGLLFIRKSTEYELNGRYSQDFGPEGFRCRFELPADRIRWRPRAD